MVAEQPGDAVAFFRHSPMFFGTALDNHYVRNVHDDCMDWPAAGDILACPAIASQAGSRAAAEFVSHRSAEAPTGDLFHEPSALLACMPEESR